MPTPQPFKRKDGTIGWRVRFRLQPGTNPVSETFDNETEAFRFAQLVDQVGGQAARNVRDMAGTTASARTVKTAFDAFCESSQAQPDTIDKYKRQWALYVAEHFDLFPLEAVTQEHVQRWVATLAKTETQSSISARKKEPALAPVYLSTKTIANVQGLLSSVFEQEIVAGRLGRNPARGVRLPRTGRRRKPVFLTGAQFSTLLSHVPEYWQPLVMLLASTGLRFSEATALTAQDFDLDAVQPVVRVDKAWKRGVNGSPDYVGPPKTDFGIRTVSLPAGVVPMMREVVVDAGDLVFTTQPGEPIRSASFHDVWQPAVKAAGLGVKPTVHDLRHSHASWLIMRGVPLTVIQRRLGHSSIKVTSDVYGHIQPDAWLATANAADDALSAVTVATLEG